MYQNHLMQGLPSHFCKRYLSRKDEIVTLVDELGDEWPTSYLARKTGLSGGWKRFAVDHDLVDGDALVFHRIQPTVFKVTPFQNSFFLYWDNCIKNFISLTIAKLFFIMHMMLV